MSLFAVELHGRGLIMVIDGTRENCGFYKTEYVWANSEGDAEEKARQQVAKKLNAVATSGDVSGVSIEVEKMGRETKLWKSLSSPGFVFYREEADQPKRQSLH